jgi:hypothetical protein
MAILHINKDEAEMIYARFHNVDSGIEETNKIMNNLAAKAWKIINKEKIGIKQ